MGVDAGLSKRTRVSTNSRRVIIINGKGGSYYYIFRLDRKRLNMQGGGIDMYDLIPNLHENDKELYSTGQKFWVGVIEGISPSPPVPRRRTKCYSPADVYLYFGHKVFSMNQKTDDGKFYKSFYEIPENELIFVQ